MLLSQPSLEILLDLIEIKMSSLEVQDLDDRRVLNTLQKCHRELLAESHREPAKNAGKIKEPQVLYG